MSLELPFGYKNIDPNGSSNIDENYGYYTSLAQALIGVPMGMRKGGRTLAVKDSSGKITEYWWENDNDLSDAGLVPKGSFFNPDEYDVTEFPNESSDPYVHESVLDLYLTISKLGVANGAASTDANNKINLIHLPDFLIQGMVLGGLVNINTGVATLSNGAKSKLNTTSSSITLTNNSSPITGYEDNEGIIYIASNSGSLFGIDFDTGDWLVGIGTSWGKVDNVDAVKTVNGEIGNVTTPLDKVLEQGHTATDKSVEFKSATPYSSKVTFNNEDVKIQNDTDGKSTKIGVQDIEFRQGAYKMTAQPEAITKDSSFIFQNKDHTVAGLDDIERVVAASNFKQINSNYTLLQTDSGKTILVDGNNRVITVPNDLTGNFHITVKVRGTGATLVDIDGLLVGKPTELTSPYTIPQFGVLYFLRDDDGNLDLTGDIL